MIITLTLTDAETAAIEAHRPRNPLIPDTRTTEQYVTALIRHQVVAPILVRQRDTDRQRLSADIEGLSPAAKAEVVALVETKKLAESVK